ncbi:uncharacterized protein [Venturia canescens]|uniref:uncharacterized protein n=1 Tax=Venturia canescens TaxID=32260 RepID=UPI001C9C33B1|nr:uncharacterized protein LOC122412408 [Venturia canescens]
MGSFVDKNFDNSSARIRTALRSFSRLAISTRSLQIGGSGTETNRGNGVHQSYPPQAKPKYESGSRVVGSYVTTAVKLQPRHLQGSSDPLFSSSTNNIRTWAWALDEGQPIDRSHE